MLTCSAPDRTVMRSSAIPEPARGDERGALGRAQPGIPIRAWSKNIMPTSRQTTSRKPSVPMRRALMGSTACRCASREHYSEDSIRNLAPCPGGTIRARRLQPVAYANRPAPGAMSCLLRKIPIQKGMCDGGPAIEPLTVRRAPALRRSARHRFQSDQRQVGRRAQSS